MKATAFTEKEKIKVFNETKGVVDGTIAADLYQEDKLVGVALLVLTCEGLSGSCGLKGMELKVQNKTCLLK